MDADERFSGLSDVVMGVTTQKILAFTCSKCQEPAFGGVNITARHRVVDADGVPEYDPGKRKTTGLGACGFSSKTIHGRRMDAALSGF